MANEILEKKVLKCESVIIVAGTKKAPVTDGRKRIKLSDGQSEVVLIVDKTSTFKDGNKYELTVKEV